jgi:hypothetical protein
MVVDQWRKLAKMCGIMNGDMDSLDQPPLPVHLLLLYHRYPFMESGHSFPCYHISSPTGVVESCCTGAKTLADGVAHGPSFPFTYVLDASHPAAESVRHPTVYPKTTGRLENENTRNVGMRFQ